LSDFLELRRISKRFGGVQALSAVDLAVAAGEVHCLVGENGSGKSTLIKIISGVQPPDPGGEIVIDGRRDPHLTPMRSAEIGIQVIYQDLSLFPNLTVAENIAIFRHLGRPHAINWRRIQETAAAAMERLKVRLDPDARVGELPVASRQLVAICRAMANEARLLIMDEPTASLTRYEVETLLQLTRELQRHGVTVVFVSHRLKEIMAIAERVSVLRDGRMVGTFAAADIDDRRLGSLMTGKEFDYRPPRADFTYAEPVLEVRNLGRADEYEDISFAVCSGEILGITGRLGAGRTELALSLFGMNPPDQGEILMHGRAVHLADNGDAIAHGIAYVPEDRLTLGLVLEQPIAANIILTVLDTLRRGLGLIPTSVRAMAVARWIRELAIKGPDPEYPVRTLSGGNQQRVVLAKWLARRPAVLILDSPTAGVDVNGKDGIYEIVARLAAEGMAVIMISDEVPEVYFHCHRVLLMREGRIAGSFEPNACTEADIEEAVDA
jgi:simple sugar transport system ATP-binding protein